MIAPTLHTDRLTMRALTVADFPAYRDAFASDHTRHLGGPMTEIQSWATFCKEVAQWPLLGFGVWGVTLSQTDELVGAVGFYGHPYLPETELGWLVLPTAAKQGIGYEAAVAARHWGYSTLKLPTLVSYIAEDNLASIALAEKLGAVLDTKAKPCPHPNHFVYRHPAPEAL